jgi:hypothetical protein
MGSGQSCHTFVNFIRDFSEGLHIQGVDKIMETLKKLKNRICVGYFERTSVGNTEYSSICLHSVVLMSVH